jgi:hypothetical protein
MAYQKKTDPFNKILAIILGVVFFVVLAVISYDAIRTNTDNRSKAATARLTYKIWDFTTNEEEWSGKNLTNIAAKNGILSATIGSKTGSIINSTVDTGMPIGNKYITIRMAVSDLAVLGESTNCAASSDGTVSCFPSTGNNLPGLSEGSGKVGDRIIRDVSPYIPDPNVPCVPAPTCPSNQPDCIRPFLVPIGGWCPTGISPIPTPIRTNTQNPKPNTKSFSFTVFYWKTGENGSVTSNRSINLRGVADNVMRDYTILIPEINALTISRIEIRFNSGVKNGDRVSFDTISLVGPAKTTLTPPSGCYYQQVVCIKAPCAPILVCPKPAGCSPDGSKCASSICPTMMPCPTGRMCPYVMPACFTQTGICKNNRCIPTIIPTTTQSRCTSDTDCPTGYICSAVPPGGCPTIIVNGIEQSTACASVPRCWPKYPIPTPTCVKPPACVYQNPPCYIKVVAGTVFCPDSQTPTPGEICKTGVNSFSVDTPCNNGYRYMNYQCYDGYAGREGGSSSCKSSDVWSSYANERCGGRSNCSTTDSDIVPL